MAVAATGPISLPLENARTLLADSSSFRSWVGAADAAEAKNHIYLVAMDPPISAKRPFAAIWHTEPSEVNFVAVGDGAGQTFLDSGALEVLFEADVAEADQSSHEDAELAFTNTVGAIIDDMLGLAGSDGYLYIRRIEPIFGPRRAHPDEKESEGDYYQMVIRVHYGLET